VLICTTTKKGFNSVYQITMVLFYRFLLRVNCLSWHQSCLRCCVCQLALDRQPSCFIRDRNVYCKTDYSR